MDEFHDEQKFKELNEREVAAWLEVSETSPTSGSIVTHKLIYNKTKLHHICCLVKEICPTLYSFQTIPSPDEDAQLAVDLVL